MRFLRLSDPLLRLLFEDEDIVAIDKPYGLNSHTNDSKIEHSEFIQDGLIEILEKQLGQKLHIIHRLDQTTSGVIIFGKSVESAKKYAEYFFHRQVKKTYLFITASQSSKTEFFIDQKIVHKAKELESRTQLKFLNKTKSFELWQANPLTGRNHQIRIHSKAAEIPILGDFKYGGAAYPFLCLHNHQIEFPNGKVIKSEPPLYFQNLSLLEDLDLAKSLFEADRRKRLFQIAAGSQECFRLAQVKDNSGETLFTIDHFGKYLALHWYKESWGESEKRKFSTFSSLMRKSLIVRHGKDQIFISDERNSEPLQTPWVAQEQKIQYELRADSGAGFGLVTNQRLQREWVLRRSKGKSVLNLFASNCNFGLAAALGEASEITLVDSNKNALAWGKRNFELNQLDPEKFKFFCRDSISFLKQSISKNLTFDLIICDVPSFFRGEKAVFKIENDLDLLLKNCLECLRPGGTFLFSTSYEKFFVDDLRKTILKVQKLLQISELEIESIQPALDFELPDERPSLKSFFIKRGSPHDGPA